MKNFLIKPVILFIMKISILPSLLFFCSLCTYATDSFSQGALDKKITLRVTDMNLSDVLHEIENSGTPKFAYSPEVVQSNKKISLNIESKPLRDVLNLLFNTQTIRFEETKNAIIISRIVNQSDKAGGAEKATITGKVTDEQNNPIPGVNIRLKGTEKGTATDPDGNFKLTVDDEINAVLLINYIGYTPQEVVVGNRLNLLIKLKPESKDLNEVVVVGYGTQSKRKVTGATSTVKSEYIQNRPITNLSAGLAGAVPGLAIDAANGGSPGKTPVISIRGTTTLSGGASALILVDGVESRLEDVDPNIIQEVTILKDASAAAIYGSKAANGVVLVTTKSGKIGQPTKIDYSVNSGFQKPTAIPQIVNSVDYIQLKNKAQVYEALYFNNTTPPAATYFSDTILQKAQNGELANTNWGKEVFKANAFQMDHSLNISGAANNTDYLIGLAYLNQNGINVGIDNFTRYNLRAKINTKIKDWLSVGTNTAFTHRFLNNVPSAEANSGRALRSSPLFPIAMANGTLIAGEGGSSGNPYINAESGSYNRLKEDILETQLLAKADITKHFSVEEKFSARVYNSQNAIWNNAVDYVTLDLDANGYQAPIPIMAQSTARSYNIANERTTVLISQSIMRYSQSIGDHSFSGLLGFQTESFKDATNKAGRINYLNGSLQTLALGASVDPTIGNGTGNDSDVTAYKMASGFGRLNYDYKNKYLIEGSFRIDGSSRFTGANKYGFFPSVSVGWNISEENFIKEKLSFIDQFKLRASVGVLGDAFSGGIGNYDFYQTIVKNPGYTFAGGTQPGLVVGKAANPDITWERSTVSDVGIDLSIFKNKLSAVFDYFVNNRSNILVSSPNIAAEFGLQAPSLNGASVRSQGYEIEVVHRNKVGNVSYFVAANLANQSNKVTGLGNSSPQYGNMVTAVGYPVKACYGYVADGFITSKEDLAAYTTNNKLNGPFTPYVGGLKYKDLNGDHIIDPTNDRMVINDNTPHYNVGLRFGATYKSFSIAANITGVLERYMYFGANQTDQFFSGGSGTPFQIQKNFFDPQNVNASLNAAFPVIRAGASFYDNSSFWLRKAAYLRMKNISLSYEINKNALKKIGISRLNVYASAENPFLIWTNYFASSGGFDPELDNPGSRYPLQKTFSLGLNLTL